MEAPMSIARDEHRTRFRTDPSNDWAAPVALVRRPTGWYLPRPADAPSPGPRRDFDPIRPAWLSNPDFVPVDTSQAGPPDCAFIDYTRPELGMNPDGEYPSSWAVWQRDDIDEPYDHRVRTQRPAGW
jgi:hypothetical protein